MLKRLIGILLIFSIGVWSQTITGSITGSVRDSSGLAVAGAELNLIHPATGVERKATSNERGDFVFPSLQPGSYELTVSMAGFKTVERKGLRLTASETLSVGDIALEVGAVSERITVTAQGSTVQTASAGVPAW